MVWVWDWKISPKNVKFFLFGSKKISSGQVKKYPDQRQVGLLIYCGSKVSSGRVMAHLYYELIDLQTLFWSEKYQKTPVLSAILVFTGKNGENLNFF